MAKQRISSGFPLPVYIDETNAKQSVASRIYVNQTSPAAVNVNLAAATSSGTAAALSLTVSENFNLVAATASGSAAALTPGNSVNLVAVAATGVAVSFKFGKHSGMLLVGVG